MHTDLRHQQLFFERLAGRYADGFAIGIPFLEGIRAAISPRIHGAVLDIGNGGLLGFDAGQAKSVTIADLSAASLRTVKTLDQGGIRTLDAAEMEKLRRVGANAMELPFRDGSFDVVVMSYVAHHMSVSSRRGSRRNVHRALAEIYRVLRDGGTLLLLENCPTLVAECVQDLSFWLAYRILIRRGRPLPYFMSARAIERDLSGLGFGIAERVGIRWSRRVHSPIFPRVSPPGWLWERVLKNRMFVAVK